MLEKAIVYLTALKRFHLQQTSAINYLQPLNENWLNSILKAFLKLHVLQHRLISLLHCKVRQ